MKRFFLLFFIAVSSVAYGQLNSGDMSRYLAKDAVQVVDGYVVFNDHVDLVDGLTLQQVGDIAANWLNGYLGAFDKERNRVISSGPGELVAVGDRELVFMDNAIAYDRTQMSYVLTVRYTASGCDVEITRIRYVYNDGSKTSRLTAEEYIVDEYSVNKKRTKLTPLTGKFRKKTLDFVDEVFASFNNAFKYHSKAGLAEIVKNAPQVMQVQVTSKAETAGKVEQTEPQPPVKQVQQVQPGQQVQPEREAVTGLGDLGNIAGKTLQGSFVRIMEGADNYMIMIYPAKEGKPHPEASMIIECRKLPEGNIGEIVNVWVK